MLDVAPQLVEGALHGLRLGILHGKLPPDEKLLPPSPTAINYDTGNALFYSGKAAVNPTGSWLALDTERNAKFEIGYIPFPAETGKGIWSGGLGAGIFISASSTKVEAAEKFLDFGTTQEHGKWSVENLQDIPAYPVSQRHSTAASSNRPPCRASHREAPRLNRQYKGVPAGQRPGGDSRVSEANGRTAASSSATQPPRELPATWGVSNPSSSSSPATARARAAGDGSTPSGSEGDWPNPGRSTATTSATAASAGTTGSHACRKDPRPCSSTSGSPPPVRANARVLMPT